MFNETYLGNPNLKRVGVTFQYTEEQIREINRCSEDPIYFVDTYCKIITLDHGLQSFKLWDFQKEAIDTIHNNRKIIIKFARQQSKTTLSVAYFVWYTLFNSDKTIAILANKGDTAREILSRYQLMYECLPLWLQQGVEVWNKGSIELENGSKVFTAATSGSGIRGRSCVAGDTIITIKNDGIIQDIEIKKLFETFDSSIPYSILTQDGFKNFKGILDQGIPDKLYHVFFDDDTSIKATPDHRFLIDTHWIQLDLLDIGDCINGKEIVDIQEIEPENVYDVFEVEDTNSYYSNGVISHNCNILYIDEAAIIPNNIADQFFAAVFPVVSAGQTTKILITSTPLGYNHFWKLWSDAENGLNGFITFSAPYWKVPGRDKKWADEQLQALGQVKFNQEILTSFEGSSYTLINSETFRNLAFTNPLLSDSGLDVYNFPITSTKSLETGEIINRDHVYVLVADTSKGIGSDYSAFTVIDVTEMPYKVVAKYRDNNISPLVYPSIIHRVATQYNMAHVLLEINTSEQVAHILQSDYEYENIIMVSKGKHGQQISGWGSGANPQMGIVTDKKVKRIGCQNLKSLIEEQKLLIFDADIISEISTFIQHKDSYAADEGYNDDLIMTLVLFAWLATTKYLSEMTDINLRQSIYQKRIKQIEDEMLTIGFDDGQVEEVIIENDNVWREYGTYQSKF